MSGQPLHTQPAPSKAAKPYKGLAMEGAIARWYTGIRKSDSEIDPLVRQLRASVPAGSAILEVAPGPGYLAIELARAGTYKVVGLDVSATFVEIARAKAREAGVAAEFNQGDAAQLPFAAGLFDFVICRAAFKNFTAPVQAIAEMHRVLRPGGQALIIDLRGDASASDIRGAVSEMGLSALNRAMTRAAFRFFLLKNAYTGAQMRQMVAQTPFGGCEIRQDAIGMQVWLQK